MDDTAPADLALAALVEKLSDSLVGPLPSGTPRRLCSRVQLPAKATAIVGVRRSGKTKYLHQLRRVYTRDGLPSSVPAGVEAQPAYEWLLTPPERVEGLT